jgi:serine/threonine-protein kinase
MERIDGTPLHKVLQKTGTLGTVQTKDLALQMCDLLQYLHTQDPPVVHRDFTPENLILSDDGRVKLIDFNVAHRLESTSTKTVVGKHAYVPPEQFRGKPTTQSDIYAFGATLFFLLTGEEPEPITRSDPSVKNVAIDKRLAAIVMRATEPEAQNRYGDVAEILTALKEIPC